MSRILEFVKTLENKPILIYGLGKSGLATASALSKAGVNVVIGDDNPENLEKLANLKHYNHDDELTQYAYLVLSPGIPFTHPEPHDIVKKAQKAEIEILCDIELFHKIYPDIKTVGVTGTNGKSTTSTLITHILQECDYKTALAGNIGTAIFDLENAQKLDWLVLEISSFQIDLCPTFRPDISVLLNLTPDHIDRHGTMEQYAAVKERLTEPAQKSSYNKVVICSDDEFTKKITASTEDRTIIEVSTLNTLEQGTSIKENCLYENGQKIGDCSECETLAGIHNAQNTACAYAVAREIGCEAETIWSALKNFAGLNHRQFVIRTINGVAYVNDSKSTNAAAAAVALTCRNNVYWIVGGRKKKNGLDGLEAFFPNIKHAFLIGESTDDFALWFDQYGIEYSKAFTLEKALRDSHAMAQNNRGQPGGAGVVLLSPACASFDQFKSFEHRGDVFTELVEALEEV